MIKAKTTYFANEGERNIEIKLTKMGYKNLNNYLKEFKAKRKEILDAGKDTADETKIPSIEDIFLGAIQFGIDEEGEVYDGWGVTDNYDMDYPVCLQLGVDFVEVVA